MLGKEVSDDELLVDGGGGGVASDKVGEAVNGLFGQLELSELSMSRYY